MKVLILGCGYLGTRLGRICQQRGWEVQAVTRNEATVADLREEGFAALPANVHDESWHDFADTDCQWIVNCVSSAGGGLDGYRTSYVEGNRSLGRWMERRQWKGKALYTSSVAVYGDAAGRWVSEGDEGEPQGERGEILRKAEETFRDACKSSGAASVTLRVGGLYGPGRHILLNSLRDNPEVMGGFGDYYLNLIRVEDAAAGVVSAFQGIESGHSVFNAVDSEPTLKREIVAWLCERLGQVVPRFDPEQPGRAAWRGRSGGRPANRRISNAKLRAETGWQPRYASFREGFAEWL